MPREDDCATLVGPRYDYVRWFEIVLEQNLNQNLVL